jgi:hypothetical protein
MGKPETRFLRILRRETRNHARNRVSEFKIMLCGGGGFIDIVDLYARSLLLLIYRTG